MKAEFLSHRRTQRGAALALVLWALFVMITVVVVVMRLVDFDLDLESLASKRFISRQLAMTGLAYAMHPKIQRDDPLLNQTFPDTTRLEVRILSEDARLNINALLAGGGKAPLQRLFQFWGVSEREAAAAADSLKDWVDEDETRGLNGAEAADLAGQDVSRPENRPFLSVAEMADVRGMAAVEKVKPDWREFFSVKSSGRLDYQDAPADFLEVFGLLSREQALAFAAFRSGPDGKPGTGDDVVIDSAEKLAAVVPLTPVLSEAIQSGFGAGSPLKRIESQGYCGGLNYRISVVAVPGQPRYLDWMEGP